MADKKEKQKSKEIQNIVNITDAGPCKKTVSVEVPVETIQKETDLQYRELRQQADVPGFRRGRAPRRLLEKRFGKSIIEQVKLKLLADSSDAAIKDNELAIMRDPDIDPKAIEITAGAPLKFEFEVEVKPDFKLPELKGIAVNKTKTEISDIDIDDELAQLQKYSGFWQPVEGTTVEVDDQVIGNVSVKAEDAVETELIDNTEVFVRKNGFAGPVSVENLDELLTGAKIGDTKSTTIELSKTYFKEEYRGKKVDVTIEIKDIKRLVPAELNEEFFKRFAAADEKELRDRIKESLQGKADQQIKSDMAQQIYKYMSDNTKFDLPTDVVADQASDILQRQFMNLMQQGLDKDQLKQQMEQLKAGSETQAKEQLKTYFIMEKVADKFKIEISEEEINGHVAQMAMQKGQRPEKMKEQMVRDGSLMQFGLQMRENKCVEKMLEDAKVTEVAAKKSPAKKAAKTAKKTTKKVKVTKKPSSKPSSKADKKESPAKKTTTKKTTKKVNKKNDA